MIVTFTVPKQLEYYFNILKTPVFFFSKTLSTASKAASEIGHRFWNFFPWIKFLRILELVGRFLNIKAVLKR